MEIVANMLMASSREVNTVVLLDLAIIGNKVDSVDTEIVVNLFTSAVLVVDIKPALSMEVAGAVVVAPVSLPVAKNAINTGILAIVSTVIIVVIPISNEIQLVVPVAVVLLVDYITIQAIRVHMNEKNAHTQILGINH